MKGKFGLFFGVLSLTVTGMARGDLLSTLTGQADLRDGVLYVPQVDIGGRLFTGKLKQLDDTHYEVIWAQELN